jgi:hypothetical protein
MEWYLSALLILAARHPSRAHGAWFSGRWHVAGGEAYVAKVKDYVERRIWRTPDFAAG